MKPHPTFYRFIRYVLLILILFHRENQSWAQLPLPECTADVPFFVMDLSSNPDSSDTTLEIIQPGSCSDDGKNVAFYVMLYPDVAMFESIVALGYTDPG
jgi:hypothetical protein